MKASYINPHESSWHPNDFTVGEQYVTDDEVFTCIGKNDDDPFYFYLEVEWGSKTVEIRQFGNRVYPNSQWIALNWEDE